jgi:hypothetical protein
MIIRVIGSVFFILSNLYTCLSQQPIFQDTPTKVQFSGVIVNDEGHCKYSKQRFNIITRQLEPCPPTRKIIFKFADFAEREEPIEIKSNKLLICNWPDTIIKSATLFDFDAHEGQSWTINRGMPWDYFHHTRLNISLVEKYYDKILSDTLYQFRIRGDHATSHTDYVTDCYISKRFGIVRLDYELMDHVSKGYFFSELYLKRTGIKSYVKNNIIKSAN